MIADLVLAGVEGGCWDAVERSMSLPRYQAIQRARGGRPGPKRGDFGDLVAYLGADPAAGRGAVLK